MIFSSYMRSELRAQDSSSSPSSFNVGIEARLLSKIVQLFLSIFLSFLADVRIIDCPASGVRPLISSLGSLWIYLRLQPTSDVTSVLVDLVWIFLAIVKVSWIKLLELAAGMIFGFFRSIRIRDGSTVSTRQLDSSRARPLDLFHLRSTYALKPLIWLERSSG